MPSITNRFGKWWISTTLCINRRVTCLKYMHMHTCIYVQTWCCGHQHISLWTFLKTKNIPLWFYLPSEEFLSCVACSYSTEKNNSLKHIQLMWLEKGKQDHLLQAFVSPFPRISSNSLHGLLLLKAWVSGVRQSC